MLALSDLAVKLPGGKGDIHAVRNVSLSIEQGERVAIIGESGSGKTMTALAMLGLQPPHAMVSGALRFRDTFMRFGDGYDTSAAIRRHAGIVFQDSLSTLNPVMRIGTQLIEVLRLRNWSRRDALAEAVRVLGRVGVPDAASRMRSYPHELSGGMRQRVMITMALLGKPLLMVADEPTTALDTTIQAQVIDLIRDVQRETGMALLLITHDLAMAAEVCERAVVMYGGYVVEDLPMMELLAAPRHPYTRALLKAMPMLDSPRAMRLEAIAGEPPSARDPLACCPFAPRCPAVAEPCEHGVPKLEVLGDGHTIRCVRHAALGLRA
jgi:oligopeptide/dipeptide ABC transporter ATP-binding protein